jgi:hypothetical protein
VVACARALMRALNSFVAFAILWHDLSQDFSDKFVPRVGSPPPLCAPWVAPRPFVRRAVQPRQMWRARCGAP